MLPQWAAWLSPQVDKIALSALRDCLNEKLLDRRWERWREGADAVVAVKADFLKVTAGTVCLGSHQALSDSDAAKIDYGLKAFLPWKKGPYSIFGREIDSEWRSDLKWDRIAPFLGSIEGQVIADIGCHNGYYMYRLRDLGAKCVLGFEPMPINFYNHQLLQNIYPVPEISLELFGVEHIDLFPESFDAILCMGILYHHTDPVGLLRKMRRALHPKGRIIIDCQGIAGADSLSLTPTGRYAGATGVWFLPTLTCLQNWIRRAGFSQQTVIYSAPLDSKEQRATPWAELKSLSDFLDKGDKSKTVEGHPAPWRHYLMVKI